MALKQQLELGIVGVSGEYIHLEDGSGFPPQKTFLPQELKSGMKVVLNFCPYRAKLGVCVGEVFRQDGGSISKFLLRTVDYHNQIPQI